MAEVQTAAAARQRTTPSFRADHVGSLLRPSALLDARAKFEAGRIGNALTREEQIAKLELIVETAAEGWG